MKDLIKEDVEEQGISYIGYDYLLSSFEYEILLKVDDDDYRGDSRLIFKDGKKYGWLQFGWGSCSGCDELQACSSIEQLTELQKTLYNNIKWFDSLEEINKFFDTHDWKGDYSWSQKEQQFFIQEARELFRKELVAHLAGVY